MHWSDDESILVYTKHLSAENNPSTGSGAGVADSLIIVANVDPHSVRETVVHLDLTRLDLPADATYTVTDLITGAEFEWGRDNYVRLDAFTEPCHILHVHTRKKTR